MKRLRPLPTNRRPTHPGRILNEEFLKPMDITISEFAKRVGMTRTAVSEIVNGRRGVTPLTAMRLTRALGMSEGFWLNLQLMVDMYDAKHSADAEAIESIKPYVMLEAA